LGQVSYSSLPAVERDDDHIVPIGASAMRLAQAGQGVDSEGGGYSMSLGLKLCTYLHVVVSLIGIGSGFVVLLGLLAANPGRRRSRG